MGETSLNKLLRIVEESRLDAERRFEETNRARQSIVAQIESHRERLAAPVDACPESPSLQVALYGASFDLRRRLLSELRQLDQLLASFDQEQLEPRRRDLLLKSSKAAGIQKLVERRDGERRRAREKNERATMNEIALRRWNRKTAP